MAGTSDAAALGALERVAADGAAVRWFPFEALDNLVALGFLTCGADDTWRLTDRGRNALRPKRDGGPAGSGTRA